MPPEKSVAKPGHEPSDRVTGRAQYTADIPITDVLHAAFVLSTEPHAVLRRVDTSQAMAIPGVVATVTGAGIGERRFGRSLRDYPVLAVDRVLFAGQRIAAVAARDLETARRAAMLIEVEYEPLDPIFDPALALDTHTPELHPDYDSYEGATQRSEGNNIQGAEAVSEGEDTDSAFGLCDEVHTHTFSWERSHSAPLETHGCLVVPGAQVHVYSTHKEPYKLRRDLAHISGRPEGDFVVHPVPIGGDFGAKGAPYVEGACYFLANESGHPVRTTMSYFEELATTGARHPGRMVLTTGLREGSIHVHQADTLFDGGAFAALKPRPTHIVSVLGVPLGPYHAPNRYESSKAVYTNTLPGAHVRSPGEFQATFAGESHIDLMARARGEDPVEFRLRHLSDPEARRVLEEIGRIRSAWRSDSDQVGLGVALFHRKAGPGQTTVLCRAGRGGVEVSVGVPDQGAGSYEALRSLVAETLMIPGDQVSVLALGADPDLTDSGAGASRVTSIAGRACIEACRSLMTELGGPPRGSNSGVYWIASRLRDLGRATVTAKGSWSVGRDEIGRNPATHGGLCVEVSVDALTGKVMVSRAALAVCAGPILNPVGHRGQLEGGFVFGLSQALFEELRLEDGQVVGASLGDYKMATAADIPPLQIELLPIEADLDRDLSYSIRAIGELGNLGVAPAIANAIDDAVGVRIFDLPITAEAVWRGMRANSGRFGSQA